MTKAKRYIAILLQDRKADRGIDAVAAQSPFARHTRSLQRNAYIALLACGTLAIVAIAVFCCRVSGDTKATLLVSQEIVSHGTIRLDRYGDADLARYGYAIQHKNGHVYDAFPLGTPLLSSPFVAIANLFGLDMRDSVDAMQVVIAASVVAALLWLLFGLARLFVAPWPAAALSVLCVFGTSIASTGLSSLFSHDFATLAATVALFHVVRGVRVQKPILASVVGTCLFLAYLCRPTMALLAPFLLLYLSTYRRSVALRSATLLGGLLACFAVWSQHEYAQWLPDYYMPQRLDGNAFATAAWQYLFGPSRGLFVFSPFLIFALALVVVHRRDADYARMLLVGVCWPIAHWLAISRFPHWWGGWSYGPRLMFDCLPGLFLSLVHSLSLVEHGRRSIYALIAVLGAFSIHVNVIHAFGNHYSLRWSAEPNVDEFPEYLSDWRYPQFLYDASLHRQRMDEFHRILEFMADAPDSHFEGFSALRGDVRLGGAGVSSIHLPLGAMERPKGRFVLAFDMHGSHVLRVRLNGHVIEEAALSGPGLRVPIVFNSEWFVDGINTVDLELTDASTGPDTFAFRSLSIFPSI